MLGFLAGRYVSGGTGRSRAGADAVRQAIAESRSLMLPWEGDEAARERDPLESLEDRGLLGWRAELEDAIVRVVEGVVPVTGADSVRYVSKETGPGGTYRLVPGDPPDGGPGGPRIAVREGCVPVREAIVFRRSFLSDGMEWGSPGAGLECGGRTVTGLAAVPVVSGGQVEGALLAFRFGEGGWDQPVTPALEMGAFFIGREIERSREWYLAARHLAQREGLHETIRTIAGVAEEAGSRDERSTVRRGVFRVVVEQVRKALSVDRIILVEADSAEKKGRIAWEAPGPAGGGREEWVSLGDTYLEWVLRTGVHRMFSGLLRTPGRHAVLPSGWLHPAGDAYLLVPVREVGDFRGVLVCAAGEGRVFHAGDAEAARDIVALMRMGISHAFREESLREEASRDGLTALYNRKAFQKNLETVLARLDGRYPCAVLMLDIDHFKRINDTHGHPAGDDVLRTVASVIRKTIRKGDMAGRYGGEEFVVYLNMADRDQAMQGAERLRMMVRQTRFLFGGKEVSVTASLGVACSPADGRDAGELLAKADAALYRSKGGGRDRTTIFRNGS